MSWLHCISVIGLINIINLRFSALGKLAKAVKLMTCIWKEPCLNRQWNTVCPSGLFGILLNSSNTGLYLGYTMTAIFPHSLQLVNGLS